MTNRPSANININRLHVVAKKLGPLIDEVVFLGGCTTGLFLTDKAVPDVRPTLNVDCIVDIISLSQYHQLEGSLRQLGFKQSQNEEIICRWFYEEIILHVMPTDETILGFSNRWYKDAIKYSVYYPLLDGLKIKIVTAPYFLATKLEAFKGRGQMDFYASHDFEDIICLLDGRLEVFEEIKQSAEAIKEYFINHFKDFLENRNFHDALPGHFSPYGTLAADRSQLLLQKINDFTE